MPRDHGVGSGGAKIIRLVPPKMPHRRELYEIRTMQRAAITQHRLEMRLRFGATKKAISGAKIPQYDYPTKKKPLGIRVKKKKVDESKPLEDVYDPGLSLDFEDYPYPEKPAETPEFVKGIERKWLGYEFAMGGPGRVLRTHAEVSLIKAARLKQEGRGYESALYFTGHLVGRAGAGVFEGVTLPVRPLATIEALTMPAKLGLDPELRKEFLKEVGRDPAGFAAEMAGGFLGGYALGKTLQYVKGKYQVAKLKYQAHKTAKFLKDYPVEDFLPAEMEMGIQYPEEVAVQKDSSALFQRKHVQVYDTTKGEPGFPEYYTRMEGYLDDVSKAISKELDTTRVLWEYKEGRLTIPIDQKPPKPPKGPLTKILKPKKGLFYKLGDEYGLVQTGHDLIIEKIPKGMGSMGEILIPWSEVVSEHLPGVRISDVSPTITKPFPGTSPYWAGLLGAASIFKGMPTIDKYSLDAVSRAIQKEITTLGMRGLGRLRRRTIEDLGIVTDPTEITEPIKIVGTGPGITFMPIQDPIQIQTPIPKQTPIQDQIPEQITIQEPIPKEPTLPRPTPFFPRLKEPTPTKTRFRLPPKMRISKKDKDLGAGYGLRVWGVWTPKELLKGKRKRRG